MFSQCWLLRIRTKMAISIFKNLMILFDQYELNTSSFSLEFVNIIHVVGHEIFDNSLIRDLGEHSVHSFTIIFI